MSGGPPSSRESLAGLAAFLPVFEAPGFVFGAWSSSTSTQPGVMVMPMHLLSPESMEFYHALYDLGWIGTDFNWTEWARAPAAARLRDDPARLAGRGASAHMPRG